MNPLIIGTAILAFFQGLSTTNDVTLAQTIPNPNIYQKQAEEDLSALYKILKTKSTETWLTQGYREVQTRISEIDSLAGYHYLLSHYVYGFRQSNLTLKTKFSPKIGIPGFLVKEVGDNLVVSWVHESMKDKIPLGARLVQLNQIEILFFKLHLYQRKFFHPATRVSRNEFHNLNLLNRHNPFGAPMKTCTFEHEQKQFTIEVNWQWLEAQEVFNLIAHVLAPDAISKYLLPCLGISPLGHLGTEHILPSQQATAFIN